jgi:hypothetical protein
VAASVGGGEPGLGDRIASGGGQENLIGIRLRHDAGGGVDLEAAHLLAAHLDLAQVHARTQLNAQLLGRRANGDRAASSPGRWGHPWP